MQQALSLAHKSKGFTSPNPCVGAVVVRHGKIVGKGRHRAAGLDHAQVEAIHHAGTKADGSTMFVTLEPCNHYGKTPPCTHKIVKAGIKKVVIACKDPNPFVQGNGIKYLQDNGIEVVFGVLEKEAKALIEDFIWYVQNDKKPFVILKCASTLDGRTSTSTKDSKWITNEKSRAFVHRLRHETDAVLIGAGTLHADNPSLTSRIENKKTKDPARIILDTNLSIKENAKVMTINSNAQTIIVSCPGASKEKKALLEKKGAKVIEVQLKQGRLDLNELMVKLGQMSILSIMIEGGSKIAGSALRSGIINKALFFLSPKLLGCSDGSPVFEGMGQKLIKDAFELKDINITMFDNDILVQGFIIQ